ncbi:MAG: hypothetical protein NC115_01930 [Bacteroidales bacterium]|nr:hypothetical protein [Bacteroidales bacterium]
MKQEIDIALKVKLEYQGYKKRNGSYFKYLSDGVSSYVFITYSSFSYHDYVCIHPYVGVRYDAVEQILNKLGQNEKKYFLPTLSCPIGYLMPENTWIEWLYDRRVTYNHVNRVGLPDRNFGQYDACADDICKAIEEYGTLYFEQYSKIENLISVIEDMGIGSGYAVSIIRLPILYYIVGRKDLGLKYISKVRKIDSENYFSDDYVEKYNALV